MTEQEMQDRIDAIQARREADLKVFDVAFATLKKTTDDQCAAKVKSITDANAVNIQTLTATHAAKVQAMEERYTSMLAAKDEQRKADMAKLVAQQDAAIVDLTSQMSAKHAAEMADLKAKTLLPAMRDYHARQLADMARKMEELKVTQDQELALLK